MSHVKSNVLPHSQAKLNLYKDYLSEYLPILSYSPYIDKINIFDIFCGAGIYSDGKIGSPIIAIKEILKTSISLEKNGAKIVPINLYINDYDKAKVDGVKSKIEEQEIDNFLVEAFNLDADAMFDVVVKMQKTFGPKERTLIFIDPYGYSKINKERLGSLLGNEKTEIILFLPVAQMYRFREAIYETEPDSKKYEGLKNFTFSFFQDNDYPSADIFEYINSLTDAFSFNKKYYTSSHYIQRDNKNYYAVFFVGPHIYGLEKFLEVKWKNDSLGKGFNQKSLSESLFAETIEEYDKSLTENSIQKLLLDRLAKSSMNNCELYYFTLKNQFLPKHVNGVLKSLNKATKIKITDKLNNQITKSSGFNINYTAYNSKIPTVFYKLNK